MKINLREAVITALIFVVVLAAVQTSLGSYRVDGRSMDPTFLPGDSVMVDKLTYRFSSPHRGQVVILWPPERSEAPYIKRVIGLPGETVSVDNAGQVYITNSDGRSRLYEEPDMPACRITDRSWTLGAGQYFVLGDNRGESRDSTEFGPVKEEDIIGKTWLRYGPRSRFGLTPDYSCRLVSIEEPGRPAARVPGMTAPPVEGDAGMRPAICGTPA